jgi:hypothetical protein
MLKPKTAEGANIPSPSTKPITQLGSLISTFVLLGLFTGSTVGNKDKTISGQSSKIHILRSTLRVRAGLPAPITTTGGDG